MATTGDRTSRQVEVLVIGGGVIGAASALAAADAGAGVALVECGSLASAGGSSRGTARLYAPAAYPDESYLEIGVRALERWRGIERVSGARLILPTGALSAGAFVERQLPLLRAAGIEAELLSADDAWRRFAARLGRDRPLLFQEEAGVIRADRAVAALLGLAREAGAELCPAEAATSIEPGDDHVVVETDRHRWRAEATIVSAGPWAADLLAVAGLGLPVAVSRQSVSYFDLAKPGARPVALIDYEGTEPYALWDPARGLKAALHARGPQVDPDGPGPHAHPGAADQVAAWVEQALPGLTRRLAAVETCLYTNTPDDQFILERHGRVVAVAACNGQGFQLAPETGRRLAQLALEPLEIAVR